MDQSGLDDIVLDSQLCDRLYKTGIINLEFKESERLPEIPFTGKNGKQVLVALDTRHPLSGVEEDQLQRLLGACHLTSDDIARINVQEQEAAMEQILRQLKIKKALFFGVPAGSIGLPIGNTEDKVIIYDNKYFIRTAPVKALMHDEKRKRALWSALKDMFDL